MSMKRKTAVFIAACLAAGLVFKTSVGLSKNAQSSLMIENIQALSNNECIIAFDNCATDCYWEWCGYCIIGDESYYLPDCCPECN